MNKSPNIPLSLLMIISMRCFILLLVCTIVGFSVDKLRDEKASLLVYRNTIKDNVFSVLKTLWGNQCAVKC